MRKNSPAHTSYEIKFHGIECLHDALKINDILNWFLLSKKNN